MKPIVKLKCGLAWVSFVGRLLLFVGVLLTAATAHAAENSVTALRLGKVTLDGDPALRLVIETKSPAIVKMSLLTSPYRLVIDLQETDWQVMRLPAKGRLNKAPATGYRFGQPSPGIGRLVVELDSPAAPFRAFALPPNDGGHRLVIDMIDNGQTAFKVAAAALRNSKAIQFGGQSLQTDAAPAESVPTEAVSSTITPPAPRPKPPAAAKPNAGEKIVAVVPPRSRPSRWVVFIDAGHGGKDPGAIGRAGTKEKQITLAAAQELGRQLNATGRVRAVLSRDDDRYLRLRERIRLARAENADLFVSLHADSAAASSARGISVFTLSETASDKEAATLARNENKADLIGGPDLGIEDPEAANELLRMFQRESMNQSTHFAGKILSQIRDMPGGDKRGHRFAGFAVLKAPDMPSVLVEMGFLSNRADEANLNKRAYRKKLMSRLTTAIVGYLEEFGPEI